MLKNQHNLNSHPSQQEILKQAEIVDTLSRPCSLVLGRFLAMANVTNKLFPSQTYLAKELGLCRATINRSVKKLHALGLINKIDRGWKPKRARIKKTCGYFLSKIFTYQFVRDKYKHLFLALSHAILISNFDAIAGIWPSAGKQQCIELVTGNKSSLNLVFKNKAYINLRSRGNGLLAKQISIYHRLKAIESKHTIEERSKVSEAKLPAILESADFLNMAAKYELAIFNENIIKHGLAKLALKADLAKPYAYLLGICKSESEERGLSCQDRLKFPIVEGKPEMDFAAFKQKSAISSISANLPPKPNSFKKESSKAAPPLSTFERMQRDKQKEMAIPKEAEPQLITAVDLANKVADIIIASQTRPFFKENLKRLITPLLRQAYRRTDDANDSIAVKYLMGWREELAVPEIVAKVEVKTAMILTPLQEKLTAIKQSFPESTLITNNGREVANYAENSIADMPKSEQECPMLDETMCEEILD